VEISQRQYRRLKRNMAESESGRLKWKHPRWRPYRGGFSWFSAAREPLYIYNSWHWRGRKIKARWWSPVNRRRTLAGTGFDPTVEPFRSFGAPSAVFTCDADPDKNYVFPNFGALNSGLPDRTDWKAAHGTCWIGSP
jgi:hypothetical protein